MSRTAWIIIDCETLSLNIESAPILSIGAFLMGIINTEEDENPRFWKQIKDWDKINENFYQVINFKYQIASGRKDNKETWEWWNKVGGEAAKLLQESETTTNTLQQSLIALSAWIKEIENKVDSVVVLGNGAAFDNALLEIAYREYNLPIPWKYTHSLCLRTLYATFRLEKENTAGLTKSETKNTRIEILKDISITAKDLTEAKCGKFITHNALHDCVFQAYKAKLMFPRSLWENIANNIHKRK